VGLTFRVSLRRMDLVHRVVSRRLSCSLVELVEPGQVSPVVGTTVDLSETPEVAAYVGEGHVRGKAVVVT
jgi:NADPH:quinone reductase-like Zn-dependent oxidoreductase